MTGVQLIEKLLHCKGVKVIDFNVDESLMKLHVWVKPYKNGACCPTCLRRCELITNADRVERTWIDAPMGEWKVIYHYCPREVVCPTHGRLQENIPWASAYSRVTLRFEHLMLIYASVMTLTAAAGLLKTPISTLSDMLHRSIERARKGHKVTGLISIGIDEISYEKGRKFATIVYDLERSLVIWVGKGKGRETIDYFFEKVLGTQAALKIKTASCDLGEAYIGAIEKYCKNATLVLDRFHVVKLLNAAVDEVRKEEWRQLQGDEKKAMKGLRWLLYRHSRTRTKDQTKTLKELKKSNNKIYRAWVLKDEFEQVWNYRSRKGAADFLEAWITRTLRSRIPSMKTFANTMRRHFEKIVTFSTTRLTNAIAEGLNRILKIIKNRASGFRNLKVYADMIYLTVGDVDISAQIPEEFRSSSLDQLLTRIGVRSNE
jgi:transposase